MPRTTRTVSFSLPPEMADRLDEAAMAQGNSRSEFVREAVVRRIQDREWSRLLRYGEEKARQKGIGPEDVPDLVEEYRAEVRPFRI